MNKDSLCDKLYSGSAFYCGSDLLRCEINQDDGMTYESIARESQQYSFRAKSIGELQLENVHEKRSTRAVESPDFKKLWGSVEKLFICR